MRKINNKQEKGVTIIALVITIVILAILAAISLSAVIGEDGIIFQAKDTKNMIENETEYDSEQIASMQNELANNNIYSGIDLVSGTDLGGSSEGGESGTGNTGGNSGTGNTGGSSGTGNSSSPFLADKVQIGDSVAIDLGVWEKSFSGNSNTVGGYQAGTSKGTGLYALRVGSSSTSALTGSGWCVVGVQGIR